MLPRAFTLGDERGARFMRLETGKKVRETMSGINKCLFVGYVGQNANERSTGSGESVLNFSIAIGEKWTDKNSGEKKERTEWIDCVLFGKRAKALAQYITKGTLLGIEGKWQTRTWEKDGIKRYSTECIVQDLQLLGGGARGERREEVGGSTGGGGNDSQHDVGNAPDDFGDIPFSSSAVPSLETSIGERWNRSNQRLI